VPEDVPHRRRAQGFTDNNWTPADGQMKMNCRKLRFLSHRREERNVLGPAHRTGFSRHFSRTSAPRVAHVRARPGVETEWNHAFAARQAPRLRKVSFHLPDFIDIIPGTRATIARHASATIGPE
jgi:hypothetical protein